MQKEKSFQRVPKNEANTAQLQHFFLTVCNVACVVRCPTWADGLLLPRLLNVCWDPLHHLPSNPIGDTFESSSPVISSSCFQFTKTGKHPESRITENRKIVINSLDHRLASFPVYIFISKIFLKIFLSFVFASSSFSVQKKRKAETFFFSLSLCFFFFENENFEFAVYAYRHKQFMAFCKPGTNLNSKVHPEHQFHHLILFVISSNTSRAQDARLSETNAAVDSSADC